MTEAFSSSKTALVNATMLIHPAHGAPIALTSDASDVAVGAVLEQLSSGSWQPLAFFSKQLRPAEKKYSTFDRELLGLYLAVKHFRYFLEGRRFAMFTDHKPLVGAMSKLSDPWTARQQRHLAHISEFSTDIRHISGKANVVADCFSRAAINNVVLGIDYKAMAEVQEHDEEIQALKTAITGLNLQSVQISNDGPKLLCDVSTGNPRPIVPKAYQRQVFEQFTILRTLAESQRLQGLVERFHRTLKAALKTRLKGPNWADELPWVKLGLRIVPKENLQVSCSELVYGEPLTLPGQFVDPNPTAFSTKVDPFRSLVKRLIPLPMSHHCTPQSTDQKSLKDARFVFIRRDGHRGPLQRPYDGPFKSFQQETRHFESWLEDGKR
ncbi:Pol polyprotein [Elysia marginata]|uniref:Pol polyprotein n=1 Tax=Elysia marginata TaxID=1093978 RepID=A0AAV4IWC6_9GAST|nr:Pol polyprotein [Elysia marginata]